MPAAPLTDLLVRSPFLSVFLSLSLSLSRRRHPVCNSVDAAAGTEVPIRGLTPRLTASRVRDRIEKQLADGLEDPAAPA